MGTRAILLSTGAAALAALPLSALAATTDFFGPIVPQGGSCLCPNTAMDWGCLLQVFQSVMNFLISFSILAVVFFIAWGGFTLITSGGNPSARTQATNRMLNAVVGLVLILGAWLIVDSVMKYLYNPSTAFSGQQFGPWNTILGSDPNAKCLRYNAHPGLLNNGNIIGDIITAANPGTSGSSALTTTGPGACSAAALQSAVPGMPTSEANTLACLAKPESNCGTSNQNYNWNKGSSAYGPFQITLKGNAPCFNNSACQQAAGVNGSLDCSTGFDSHGNPIPGSSVVAACQRAAINLQCSAQAADCVYKKQGPAAWTADQNSSTQGQCIAAYANK